MLYTLAALNEPSANRNVSAVILDFGGVLGLPLDAVRARTMASLCGVSAAEFSRLYQRDRLEFDRGTLSTEEYWTRILSAAGREPAPGLIAKIEEEDSLGWTRVNLSVVAWAAELRSAGYLTAILSNMPPSKLEFMRQDPAFAFINEFHAAIFSCDFRLVKPEPAIYETCLRMLARKPAECLFLDDSPVNVEGGRAAGIPSILFRGAEEAQPELSGTWGLPVKSLGKGARP